MLETPGYKKIQLKVPNTPRWPLNYAKHGSIQYTFHITDIKESQNDVIFWISLPAARPYNTLESRLIQRLSCNTNSRQLSEFPSRALAKSEA